MNNKRKKIRHLTIGILIFAIIAGTTAAYGISHLYASPREKTIKAMQQSVDTFKQVLEGYIDKVAQLDPMGNHTYTGDITVLEFTYDGVDYRPDTTNNSHKYSIVTNNNNITLSMPQVEDGTLVVDKNDILPYGLAKIDSEQTGPLLRAMLSHIIDGYEAAVKDNIESIKAAGDTPASKQVHVSGVSEYAGMDTDTKEVYSMAISDKSLISGFNTFIDEMYKDSTLLPYISLLNVNGVTIDKIKSKFNMYAEGVNTIINMNIDTAGKLTGIELACESDADNQLASISIRFTGENNIYDSIYMTVETAVINNNYVNASIQLDMQNMDNIRYAVNADVKYHRHSMGLKAAGDMTMTK